jgi:hypothetical protein
VKHRTFAWLALGFVVVAGNTALVLWLEKRPSAGSGSWAPRSRPPAPAATRPPSERESGLAAALLAPREDARPRLRVAVVDAQGDAAMLLNEGKWGQGISWGAVCC